MKLNKLDKTTFAEHKEQLMKGAENMLDKFSEDPYFTFLCKEECSKFLSKPGPTNAKRCFKESTVYGVLSAYKLFYVGCSRASKRLTVLIDRNKVQGNIDAQKAKFEDLGFVVQTE